MKKNRKKIEIADIFKDKFGAFLLRNNLPSDKIKVINAIINCRTIAYGFHADKCDECGEIRVSYNSCTNRHCPKCQSLASKRWLEKRIDELLPVQYFHVVFTIPDDLNQIMLTNQKKMYQIFFEAMSQTLLDLSEDKYKAKTGIISILHTWGQNISYHPHIHCIIPGGGLTEDKLNWNHSKKKFLISIKILSAVFKGKFMELFKKSCKKEEIIFTGESIRLNNKYNFKRLINELYNKNWIVFAKKPFGSPKQVLKYLGRYTHKVAISNNRILKYENGEVSFRWKDYKDDGKSKIMTLKAEEFIRRFLLHILPNGFFKIRYYGIFSNRIRKKMTDICRKILNFTNKKISEIKVEWEEILGERRKNICPCCGNGKMEMISIYHPKWMRKSRGKI